VQQAPDIDYPRWLAGLPESSFNAVADAAETILTIQEALANDSVTLLGELFRDEGDGPITVWEHYPADDSRDPETGAMFYYHAHVPKEWDRDEHGHFHLFVRPSPDAEFSHIMAIAMTPYGVPSGLFATNGWVTDETMRPADEILELLEQRWEIARARPSWLVVQWLGAMVKLLRPQAATLLLQRDQVLDWTPEQAPSSEILGDQSRHILAELSLNLVELLEAIQSEAASRDNAFSR